MYLMDICGLLEVGLKLIIVIDLQMKYGGVIMGRTGLVITVGLLIYCYKINYSNQGMATLYQWSIT